jgi:hypothetical protein
MDRSNIRGHRAGIGDGMSHKLTRTDRLARRQRGAVEDVVRYVDRYWRDVKAAVEAAGLSSRDLEVYQSILHAQAPADRLGYKEIYRRQLVKWTRCSPRTIDRSLRRLRRAGLLRARPPHRKRRIVHGEVTWRSTGPARYRPVLAKAPALRRAGRRQYEARQAGDPAQAFAGDVMTALSDRRATNDAPAYKGVAYGAPATHDPAPDLDIRSAARCEHGRPGYCGQCMRVRHRT